MMELGQKLTFKQCLTHGEKKRLGHTRIGIEVEVFSFSHRYKKKSEGIM